MQPVATALVVGALMVGNKWARGKVPTMDNAVGVVGILVGLSLIAEANTKLASTFGTLIVVSVALIQGPVIFDAIGKGAKPKPVGKAGSAINGAAVSRAGSAVR